MVGYDTFERFVGGEVRLNDEVSCVDIPRDTAETDGIHHICDNKGPLLDNGQMSPREESEHNGASIMIPVRCCGGGTGIVLRRFNGWLTGSTTGRVVLCLVLPVVLVIVFAVFRWIVRFKMAGAWREAARLPNPNTGQTGVSTVDPLQGVRPEFLYDTTDGAIGGDLIKASNGVPLAIIHGIEITAKDMDREAELLARLMPGTYVQSVEYAPGAVTYFTSLDEQLRALCLRLRQHHVFGHTYEMDIMGHSSGAILARAVAQNAQSCLGRTDAHVRHYVGLAGPQQGVVAAIPGRFGEKAAKLKIWGPLLATIARTRFVQTFIVSTAAYLYDPRVSEDDVRTNFGVSSLLGRLNQGNLLPPHDGLRNLGGTSVQSDSRSVSAATSSNTLSVSGNVLLVASLQDEVVRPTESAFFSRAVGLEDWRDVFGDHDGMDYFGNPRVLRAVCDTDLWHRDTIHLRRLWQEGRVFVYRSPTYHGPLPEREYARVVAPFLCGDIAPEKQRAPSQVVSDLDQFSMAKLVTEKIGVDQEVEMQVLTLDR